MGVRGKIRRLRKRFSKESRLGYTLSKPDEVELFLSRIRKAYVPVDLVRIGGDSDGGYLTPDIFDTITHCFSPGVDRVARFEAELSKRYQIKSFMADASVDKAPVDDPNFDFDKLYLGNRTEGHVITLSDWMAQKVADTDTGLVLQMDIEGGEYEVLVVETMTTLERFSVMVVEFHGLENLRDTYFLKLFSSVFEKLSGAFSIVHLHPNNCCGFERVCGHDVPRVLEVTFLRTDLVDQFRTDHAVSLPHPLDRANVPRWRDIEMPAVWWRTDAS